MRKLARSAVMLAVAAGTIFAGAGVASAATVAEDHSVISAPGYYSDPTPVAEYERRLNKAGACRIATARLKAWKPGQPLPPESVSKTMITCMQTP